MLGHSFVNRISSFAITSVEFRNSGTDRPFGARYLKRRQGVQPFSIQCTTCRRSLRVVNPEAVEQIVSCPKCGSMVMVHAPAGWDLQAATESSSSGVNWQRCHKPIRRDAIVATWSHPPTTPAKPDPANSPVNHLEASSAAALAMLAQPQPPAENRAQLKRTPIAKTAPPPEKKSPWKDPPSAAAAETAPTTKNESPKAEQADASVPAQTTDAVAAPSDVVAKSKTPPIAANDAWPKWFMPAVAATLLAGVLIFAVRAVLHWSDGKPATVIATNRIEQPDTAAIDKPTAELLPAETAAPIRRRIMRKQQVGRVNSAGAARATQSRPCRPKNCFEFLA